MWRNSSKSKYAPVQFIVRPRGPPATPRKRAARADGPPRLAPLRGAASCGCWASNWEGRGFGYARGFASHQTFAPQCCCGIGRPSLGAAASPPAPVFKQVGVCCGPPRALPKQDQRTLRSHFFCKPTTWVTWILICYLTYVGEGSCKGKRCLRSANFAGCDRSLPRPTEPQPSH
jgi:hypothetical protein